MTLLPYEVYVIRYAWRPLLRRKDNFLGGDPLDAPMPMDYNIWAVRNSERTLVIDVGFSQEVGERRGRTYLRAPREGLALLGIKSEEVRDVIITHMHWDHIGTLHDFPVARFHVQDKEMAFVTGRYMRYEQFNYAIEVDDVMSMVRNVFTNRVIFHNGEAEIAPGISVHHTGGHTKGMQCVRVFTKRGWVVLASDVCHYYENIETNRFFRLAFDLGEMADGFDILRRLASSPNHIIPGHDPEVMKRYPAAFLGAEGIVARLDVDPKN